MTQASEKSVRLYVSDFERFESTLNGQLSSQLREVRRSAIARFAELGFPTTRDEEWRFTNVGAIAKAEFSTARRSAIDKTVEADIAPFTSEAVKLHRLVFLNGYFSPQLSRVGALPSGVKVGSLAAALSTERGIVEQYLTRKAPFGDNAFTALNTAFLYDGAFVYVPDGVSLPAPVQLLFVSTGNDEPFVSHPRNLIIVGSRGGISIVESYVSLRKKTYFTNVVTEMSVGEGAIVEHDLLQRESTQAFHIGTLYVHQKGASTFKSNAISLGGALARNNINVILDEPGCECTLNGLSLATGTQHIDNHTTIDHASPSCVSHELYKAILDGKARGVFNGKIFVRRDAQKTDAKQTNKTLLLSDDATIDTKPQLEIFADDVKCTHGAAVGQLDEEQVFYLRTRGIPEEEARDILTFAFATDVIRRIHVEQLREQMEGVLRGYMQRGRLAQEQ